MQPSKSLSSASDERAVGERLEQLRGRDLPRGQEHHDRDASGGAVGGERGRGVPRRRAGDRADRLAAPDHGGDRRDQDGHAEILEGARVARAAEFYKKVVVRELPRKFGARKEWRGAFAERDNVFYRQLGQNPLAFAPDARSVDLVLRTPAALKEFAPVLR
jgi:hypothetical protein